MSEMATKILEDSLGKIVLVRLRGGKKLRGRLKGFDQHLNLVLDETDDTTEVENVKKLGAIIVRGDNVVIISPPPRWNKWERQVKAHHKWVDVPRRCGRRAYNVKTKKCSACAYGESAKIRRYSWQTKTLNGARLL